MSYDINSVMLVGRLTKDPELKYTPNGKAVCTFDIANGNGKNNDGSESTSFFRIVAWGKTAEAVKNYSGKGKQIAIDGRLSQRSWTTQDGVKHYAIEVIANRVQFLTPRDNSQNGQSSADDSRYYDNSEPTFGGSEWDAKDDGGDESVPF